MLSEHRIVMIWRRVSNLIQARDFARKMFRSKIIGSDQYTVMFDVKSTILAYWSQEELTKPSTQPGDRPLDRLANQCGGINLERYPLVVNPAYEVSFVSDKLSRTVADVNNVFRLRTAMVSHDPLAPSVRIYDSSGNAYSFFGQKEFSVSTKIRLPSIAGRRSPIGSINMMVSDMGRSARFYSKVLGLKPFRGRERGHVSFRLGAIALSLRNEGGVGVVRTLARTGRFNGDLAVIHTGNIRDTHGSLREKGVQFPYGIEKSPTGEMATFYDPDGYAFALWQPSGEDGPGQPINFYPTLKKLLA